MSKFPWFGLTNDHLHSEKMNFTNGNGITCVHIYDWKLLQQHVLYGLFKFNKYLAFVFRGVISDQFRSLQPPANHTWPIQCNVQCISWFIFRLNSVLPWSFHCSKVFIPHGKLDLLTHKVSSNPLSPFLQGSWLWVHIAASRSPKSLLHVFAISAHALLCRRYSQNYSTSGTPEHSLNLKKQSVMPWISVRQTVRLKSAKILISPVKHNLLCEWSAKVLWLCRRATGGCGGGEWPLYWGHGEPDPGGSSCGRDGAIPADPATLLRLTTKSQMDFFLVGPSSSPKLSGEGSLDWGWDAAIAARKLTKQASEEEEEGDASRRMLKTITSSLPALHESSYTVVDVKFETGQNPAMDAVANHLDDSNIFEQQQQEFCDDDEEEVLQTPNSSPPQEAVNNKRKRSVPKKFSVDEDENPMHQQVKDTQIGTRNLECWPQVEKEALSTIFSPDNGSSSIVKTESVDYSMHSYDDIAVPESNDHKTFRKVMVVILWYHLCASSPSLSSSSIQVFVGTIQDPHSSFEPGWHLGGWTGRQRWGGRAWWSPQPDCQGERACY